MLEPKILANEERRLQRLHDLGILDTPPEERFDRLTRLARHVFDVPIALVSLVDRQRQWFKSRQGLGAIQTPRNISFCGHSILDDRVFVVTDAANDERFRDNPLVTGEPNIRFYAGAPLSSPEGLRVGTLCVIAPKPRPVSDVERQLLADLAVLVEQELFFADISQARQAAVDASRTKSAFLANMSHEIRTPLNAIVGSSELLASDSLDAEQKELVETIRCASDTLLALVNGVLDMSKIESGKLELDHAAFSLHDCIADRLRLVAGAAASKGLRLESSIGDGLDTVVRGDPDRLGQVLLNLLQNAVKFTATGSVSMVAKVVARRRRRLRVRLEVTDTGIGIAGDRLAAIFEPFVQADNSTTRRFGGSGLGLAICRQLVELMGGKLEVESVPGEGSRFWFELTFPVPAVDITVAGPARRPRTARRQTILLVEDNLLNQRVASAQLHALGHDLLTASSGEEALRVLAERAFDAVLIDVHMPGLDGLETVRQFRALERGRRTPVIAMTASAFQEDRRQCLAAGMDDFVPKPAGISALAAALERVTRPAQ